jgi:hypothetical protein
MTIATQDLAAATARRNDELLGSELDRRIELLLANFERVTADPHKMGKLRGLLRHYAKLEHPWRQCVADNTKRFGPERAKSVCSVLKDTIRQTTHWRGHNMAEDMAIVSDAIGEPIDDDIAAVLEQLGERCDVYRVIVGLDEPPIFEGQVTA